MDNPPKDKRAAAMFAVLFGSDWEKLDGDVAFEKGSVESWVNAVEQMLAAADAVDPIRVAIRGLLQDDDSGDRSGSPFPSRAGE